MTQEPFDHQGEWRQPQTHAAVEAPAEEYLTDSARQIMEVLLPRWRDSFLAKNEDYGDQHRVENGGLGFRAEFVGMHRRMYKLRQSVWEGLPLNGEQPEEILWDLIGTAFLMLDLAEEEKKREQG